MSLAKLGSPAVRSRRDEARKEEMYPFPSRPPSGNRQAELTCRDARGRLLRHAQAGRPGEQDEHGHQPPRPRSAVPHPPLSPGAEGLRRGLLARRGDPEECGGQTWTRGGSGGRTERTAWVPKGWETTERTTAEPERTERTTEPAARAHGADLRAAKEGGARAGGGALLRDPASQAIPAAPPPSESPTPTCAASRRGSRELACGTCAPLLSPRSRSFPGTPWL